MPIAGMPSMGKVSMRWGGTALYYSMLLSSSLISFDLEKLFASDLVVELTLQLNFLSYLTYIPPNSPS